MKKIDPTKFSFRGSSSEDAQFPSFDHKVAWKIAVYFNEPYNVWVRHVKNSFRLAGQIESEFEYIKGRKVGERQRVRMLMAYMFPK